MKEHRILVVEQDPKISKQIRKVLKRAGYTVELKAKGDEALQYLKEQQADLLLLNSTLPDFSLREMIGQIHNIKQSIPYVVITETSFLDHGNLTQLGAEDFIIKDESLEQRLESTVNHIIDEMETREELNRAREALKQREEQYRTLIENAYEGIAVIQDDKLVFLNPRFSEMTGYPRETLIDLHLKKLIYQGDMKNLKHEIRMRTEGAVPTGLFNFRIVNAYGEIRWFRISAVKIEWLSSPAVLGFFNDITDQIEDQAALARSENRFREIFERSHDAIVVIKDYRIVIANPQFNRLFGLKDSSLKKQASILNMLIEEDRDRFREILRNYQKGEMPPSNIKIRAQNQQSKLLNLDVSLSPIQWDDALALICIIRDMSEQRTLEAQLMQAQKMESVGRLAGGVAHDFNNLLTVIMGYSEMALSLIDQKNPLYHDIEEIHKTTNRASNLIRQLLAFSKNQLMNPQILNLPEIVSDMKKMLRRLISENITLHTQIDGTIWPVKADPVQIEQVIVNLVVNSRDAIRGEGQLTIELCNREFNNSRANIMGEIPAGQYVLLKVTDDGIGISEENRQNIFEPFFTTKKKEQGTGLGLSTVYGIVKQSGGYIELESELNKGTIFNIYLPKAESTDGMKLEEAQKVADLSEGNEKILVVEDDPYVLDIAVRTLYRYGFRVLQASDGEEALELCRGLKEPVDLVLSDVVMPRMNGVQLIKKIRELWPDTEVLLMSGYSQNALPESDDYFKEYPFIQKPFHPADFTAKIRLILNKK